MPQTIASELVVVDSEESAKASEDEKQIPDPEGGAAVLKSLVEPLASSKPHPMIPHDDGRVY